MHWVIPCAKHSLMLTDFGFTRQNGILNHETDSNTFTTLNNHKTAKFEQPTEHTTVNAQENEISYNSSPMR